MTERGEHQGGGAGCGYKRGAGGTPGVMRVFCSLNTNVKSLLLTLQHWFCQVFPLEGTLSRDTEPTVICYNSM